MRFRYTLLIAAILGAVTVRAGNNFTFSDALPQSSYHVTPETAAGIADQLVEIDGHRYDDIFTGTGRNVLYSGYRFESIYTITSPLNVGADTRHGLVGFFEMNAAQDNQYFSAAAEFSNKCFAGSASPATAACVDQIEHGKMFNVLGIDPLFPMIGSNTRLDEFSTGFESTSYSTHSIMYGWRFERNGGRRGLVFDIYMLDHGVQMVHAGGILKLPEAGTVTGNSTVEISTSCGGQIVLTSTGPITINATTPFNAPSSNATDGNFNQGCEITVSNNNLSAASVITIPTGSSFLTPDGKNVVLRALGGSFKMISYPTAATWQVVTEPTKNHLTNTASLDFGATLAGACDSLTITVSGAVDGDPVTLGLPNALAASDVYQSFYAFVSTTDTVTVKRCNLLNSGAALSNPAAATVRVDVWKH